MKSLLKELESSLEELIESCLAKQAQQNRPNIVVAYSGGRDSTVLLHGLVQLKSHLPIDLRAIHINHGLLPEAAAWAGHCQQQCGQWGIPLLIRQVQVEKNNGKGLEAAARTARYKVLQANLVHKELLVTAHHQDDQAETVLLQLFRGAGPHGLAAMPRWKSFGLAFHARPLLNISAQAIAEYAEQNQLHWIDDPSNQSTKIDRNFLRHQIIPALKSRWPAINTCIARSAHHCGELISALSDTAHEDLASVMIKPDILDLKKLGDLPFERQQKLMRYWFQSFGPGLPSTQKLQAIFCEVINAREDASPIIRIGDCELRRYRARLFQMSPLAAIDSASVYPWTLNEELEIPGVGTIRAQINGEEGIDVKKIEQASRLEIRFRQGGEAIALKKRGRHPLKKLFQEAGIPPWIRERTPLLYLDDELASVVGYWTSEPFLARPNAPAVQLRVLGTR